MLGRQAEHVIDTDISVNAIEKAKRLAEQLSISEKIEFRTGNGLEVLRNGEAQVIFLMGIGGTLIRKILENCEIPIAGAQHAVLQPMKSPEDIRLWLYQNGYHIRKDQMICEGDRYYQVFSVQSPDGCPEILPEWWPPQCWSVGYKAVECNDPILEEYLEKRIRAMDNLIRKGAAIERERKDLHIILQKMKGRNLCN